LQIGGLQLKNKIWTAPMAGITDRPFRNILHRMGAGLVFTEMISDKALVYKNKETLSMLNLAEEDRPVAVQLCGSEPKVMAQAAKIIEAMGASLIDINMGCPAPKIVRNGEGCSLMQRPELAAEIVAAIRNTVSLPVTVKIRKGMTAESVNAVSFAQKLEAAGAQAITVHGRNREEYYSGKADWDMISQVAATVTVPVIGNGDIYRPEETMARLAESGCVAVMIGRGMLGNPWLVRDAVRLQEGLAPLGHPGIIEVLDIAREQLAEEVSLCGEKRGLQQMRKHLAWYIKGQRGASAMRNLINQQESLGDLLTILDAYAMEISTTEKEAGIKDLTADYI